MTTIVAGTLCRPGPPTEGWLAFDDGRIVDTGTGRAPADAAGARDAVVVPGFVDLQVNGVDGVDFATADSHGWRRARRALAAHGTTACCPTLVSAPLGSYAAALDRVAAARAEAVGTTLLGAHLEGPFLGGAPGAHPPGLLRAADVAWLGALLDARGDEVAVVTLAPEADPGLVATTLLAERGVVVALGHSTAPYDEARAAADAGARVVTHLFNGMGPLHHREPGLAGAALDDERLTPTLIADFVHVHPAALRLAIGQKRNIALVSDAVAIGGGIEEREGAAWLADGTLAGSTLTMDQAVRNVVAAGVPLARAVEMATSVPADVLGADDRGRLVVGARADVVALDARTLAVRSVWIAGELAAGTTPA